MNAPTSWWRSISLGQHDKGEDDRDHRIERADNGDEAQFAIDGRGGEEPGREQVDDPYCGDCGCRVARGPGRLALSNDNGERERAHGRALNQKDPQDAG